MLEFYEDGTRVAVGVGVINEHKEFTAEITEGKVAKNGTYVIQESGRPKGRFRCDKGAEAGKKGHTEAKFHKLPNELLLAHDYLATVAGLHSSLEAAEKVVTIDIDDDDLQRLKDSGYRLCFAKKVGNRDYNVVWQSYTGYITTNTFSWTPQYQLFGTNTFKAGVEVKATTKIVSIGLGETSVLNEAGILFPPATGGKETAITMDNEYGWIHPGLNQLSTGLDGSQFSTPIYVASSGAAKGIIELTPVEKVLVWFEQNIETSTMFSDARSNEVEIDLTTVNEAARLYKDGKWSNPG